MFIMSIGGGRFRLIMVFFFFSLSFNRYYMLMLLQNETRIWITGMGGSSMALQRRSRRMIQQRQHDIQYNNTSAVYPWLKIVCIKQ